MNKLKEKLNDSHYLEMIDRLKVVMNVIDNHCVQHQLSKADKQISSRLDKVMDLLYECQQLAKGLDISKTDQNKSDLKSFNVKFKDIDPDTGNISQDMVICVCEDELNARWIKESIEFEWFSENGANDPNREFYVV